jgi:hypothetical protein
MKQFAAFFTITLKHTFYVGNIGKDLELMPSPQTALQMQRKLKIKLFRKNGSGTANTPFMTVDLPTPDWKRVTQTAVDQPVFSDMYIYL